MVVKYWPPPASRRHLHLIHIRVISSQLTPPWARDAHQGGGAAEACVTAVRCEPCKGRRACLLLTALACDAYRKPDQVRHINKNSTSQVPHLISVGVAFFAGATGTRHQAVQRCAAWWAGLSRERNRGSGLRRACAH